MSNHCVCCGAPTDTRLCPERRAEVDQRAREMVEERLRKSRGRWRV